MPNATALLLLAFAALAATPVASAFSSGAEASTAMAAEATAPVPAPTPLGGGSGVDAPAVAAQSTDALSSTDVPLQVPALPALPAITADVTASASVGTAVTPVVHVQAGEADPASGDGAFTPSGSTIDPAVAAVAVPVAVIAVGVATGGLGLRMSGTLGAWGARGLRALLGLLPLGLFSRIERGRLLDNPVRARVHDAVAQGPGLTISEIQAKAGIAWGTTVHHLRRLEDNGLLVSVTRRANRHYFLANSPAAAQRTAIATILHPTARRIATLVALRPGIDQTGLCQTLGLNGPSASKHLGQFRGEGLVASQRVGRRTIHHPTPGLHAALGAIGALSAPPEAILAPIVVARQPLLTAIA